MSAGRAHLTVVMLARDRTLRVDVAGKRAPRVLSSWTRAASERPSEARLSESLAEARPAARVLVLLESAWTQTVDLAAAALRGLARAEVERLLAYELEPLDGIAAVEAAIAYRPLAAPDESERLWATVVTEETRAALLAACAAAGTRLAGIAHPLMPGDAREERARIEVWEGATLCVSGRETCVIGARAGQRSWAQGVTAWLERERSGGSEPIDWCGRARPELLGPEACAEVHDLGPDPCAGAELERLARAAHESLRGAPGFPCLVAPPRARFVPGPRLVSLALALAVVGVGASQLSRTTRAAEGLEQRAADAETRKAELELEKKRELRLAQQRDALRKQVADERARLARLELAWHQQGGRLPALLAALQRERPAGLAVQTLDASQSGVAIAGAALQAGAIDAFVSELARALQPVGWVVHPPTLREAVRGASVYPQFEIAVELSGPLVPQGAGERQDRPEARGAAR